MLHTMLVLMHLVGVLALGVAIAGMLEADAHARRANRLAPLRDALRREAMLKQRVVAPAVLVLLATGVALTATYYGGWDALRQPWLAAMVLLFTLEGLRANTLGRSWSARLERLAAQGERHAQVPPEITDLLEARMARFSRALESSVYLLIVALGVGRPQAWATVVIGMIVVVLVAGLWSYRGEPSPASVLSSASVDGDGSD